VAKAVAVSRRRKQTLPGVLTMDKIRFDNSEVHTRAAKRKGPLRRLLGFVIVLASFLGACCLLALEASEPFSEPDSCIMCHEMKPVHDRWAKSSHHDNASGITVTCIECHLAPREDTYEHLKGKITKGAAHAWVHFFGEYDEAKSRKLVQDTMPNQRCTHCHDNLTAKPSTPAVGAVHEASLAETGTRTYACVTCHAYMHTDPPPPPEKKYYDEYDNYKCYDCHAYLQREKEPLVVRHEAVGVGCVKCHGTSQAHMDDESEATAPDKIFAKSAINASCRKCHSEAKMKKVVSHKPWYAGKDPAKEVCTDCHGKHRVPDRKKKWDKKTRKLIWRDGYAVDPTSQPATKPKDPNGGGMDMDMGM